MLNTSNWFEIFFHGTVSKSLILTGSGSKIWIADPDPAIIPDPTGSGSDTLNLTLKWWTGVPWSVNCSFARWTEWLAREPCSGSHPFACEWRTKFSIFKDHSSSTIRHRTPYFNLHYVLTTLDWSHLIFKYMIRTCAQAIQVHIMLIYHRTN